ncbi:MAG: efflux transporter outer membrane subunit [Pseudomonadota bacterium]
MLKKSHPFKILILALSLNLSGCASLDFLKLDFLENKASPKETIAATKIAPAWQTALPHDGKLSQLQTFWMQYQDPLLLALIEKAQTESVNIATASSKIAEARANRVSALSSLLPTLDSTLSSSKAVQQPAIGSTGVSPIPAGVGQPGGAQTGAFGFGGQAITTTQINAQAAWELDLFGVNRGLWKAAQAQEKAVQAGWHDARVAVAAELATSYFNQRFCQMQLAINQNDAKSRAETARVTEISYKAGFSANGVYQLALAGAADAAQQVKVQQAQCDLGIKELVALTDLDEITLRQKLAETAFATNETNQTLFSIAELPATIISQRPDIVSAEADLMTTAAEVKNTQAQRLPKVSLNGSIGWMRLSGSGFKGEGEIWSLGPISITLPIFDAGKRRANVDTAEAKYAEAAANYRSKVRYAVKEVEDALVNLHASTNRQADVQAALTGYQASLLATEQKVSAGFANLIELEENRRYALQAQTNQVNVLKDRNNAWISLYRAVGGGWQNPASAKNNTGLNTKNTQENR